MASILSANEIGEGFPVLIIHGWQMSGKVEQHDFEPIFNKIPGFRRIYVDLPGMGSTPAENIKDMDEIYLRLTQFVDAQFGASRFLVIGTSAGGYLARAVAQKYQNQVDGLLLRVPLIEPKDDMRDLDAFQPLVKNEEFIDKLSAEDRGLLGDVPIQTPAYFQLLKSKFEEVIQPAIEASDSKVLDPIRSDAKGYSLSFSLDRQGERFFAPTLIVCGRHDGVVGYRDSLRLLELYPRSTYVVLDRGTHSIPVDETGVFEVMVRDWIVRVNEWRNRAQVIFD